MRVALCSVASSDIGDKVSRKIEHRYEDPLDAVWTRTAEAMELRIVRSGASYASCDGHGILSLSDQAGMDPDDCLAQMIFHEICHWLVQGIESIGWVDWGLDNEGNIHDEREHACLRLQAALLAPYGLRELLGPTTDFRVYYDALPLDPFEERAIAERESITRGLAAYNRRNRQPFRDHLERALEATAQILRATQSIPTARPGSLLTTLKAQPPRHRLGPSLHPGRVDGSRPVCGDCAWAVPDESDPTILSCQQSQEKESIASAEPACERFENAFDCLSCGACCREAYDTVEVPAEDPAQKHHLPLMVKHSSGYDMKRSGSRCICLMGGLPLDPAVPSITGGREPADAGERTAPLNLVGGAPFTCSIYETRPRTCRDFTIFSENCLEARRLVGLSR